MILLTKEIQMKKTNFLSAIFAASMVFSASAMAGQDEISHQYFGVSVGNSSYDVKVPDQTVVKLEFNGLIYDQFLVNVAYETRKADDVSNLTYDKFELSGGYVFPLDLALPADAYVQFGYQYIDVERANHYGNGGVEVDDQGLIAEVGLRISLCDWFEANPYVGYSRLNEIDDRSDIFGVKGSIPLAYDVNFTFNAYQSKGDLYKESTIQAGLDFKF